MKHVSTFVVVIFILVIGFVGTGLLYGYRTWVGPQSDILGDTYVAVFLTTGDVYFGKIESLADAYVVLRDVYYPRANEDATNVNDPNVLLIKTGNELHGPQDEMHINRDHVVMIQPLRNDSQVVSTIAAFQESLTE